MTQIIIELEHDESLQERFEQLTALLSAYGYEVRSVHLVVEVDTLEPFN